MKFRTVYGCVVLFILVTFFNITLADTNAIDVQAATKLLTEISSKQNATLIINRMHQLLPQVKKISFPANEPALHDLTGYTFDAVKNHDFYSIYLAAIKQIPNAVRKNNAWLDLASSTAAPDDYYTTPLGNIIHLHACQPHNCPTDIDLLYNPKTKTLWGIAHIDDKFYLLNNPTNDQIAVLLVILNEYLKNYFS